MRPIRSSVLSPIEPVAPRTEIRRGGLTALVSISMLSDVNDGSTGSPNQQAAAGARRIAEGNNGRYDGGKQEAVDAVEQATMTRD